MIVFPTRVKEYSTAMAFDPVLSGMILSVSWKMEGAT